MNEITLKIIVNCQTFLASVKEEAGQDLIEYALVCALIAFGAIAGMQSVATSINNAFGNIGNTLSANA